MDFRGFYDKIIFDVDKPILRKYTGKQGDTKSRGLYVTVTQRNVEIKDLTGLSMRLFYEKPDKTRGLIDGVVDGDKFRIDYTNQMFAVPGVVKAELRLMGANGEVITDKAFKISVDSSIADGSIISKDERGILDRAFELAEDIIPRLELLDVELLEDVQNEMLQGQLKVAKVEKELNDYKATMRQVNIHQSPTQKASGYGIVSLLPNAAEGQISVVLKGNTIYNFLGNAGDCESINDFVFYQGTGVLDSNNKVFGNYGIKVTIASGYTAMSCKEKILSNKPLDTGRYYLVSAYVKNGNAQQGIRMRFWNGPTSPQSTTDFTGTYFSRIGFKLQPSDFSSDQSIYFDVRGAEGQYVYIDGIMVNEITQYEYNNVPVEQLLQKYPFVNNTKSTVCAIRLKSVSEDESEVSTAYVVAKDEQGKIAELRSLPNGAKDEVRVSGGKLIKRVSDEVVLNGSEDWTNFRVFDNTYRMEISGWTTDNNAYQHDAYFPAIVLNEDGEYKIDINVGIADERSIGTNASGSRLLIRVEKEKIDAMPSGGTLAGFKEYLAEYPVTLIYQLATPIEIPIQTSGSLVSYPSGMVYIEPFVADAGIYTDKMSVLHQDLPIKTLEKLSKIDFMTGLETELDVSDAVIAEDKLSFTHPDLVDGDIVFFTYEYDRESTEGETEIEYYDSRYVIKDSVTGKFYKWQITVADGVPSIELKEV